MRKQIAIIDPFVKSPAVSCFNRLVQMLNLPASYHLPSLFGNETLYRDQDKTSAYIVLGSASHVHENLPWHTPLAQFLVEELHKNKPVLGCCFGHQLMCHAFGAKVEYYESQEVKLSGKRKVTICQDQWNFAKGEEFHLAITHRQVVKDLPATLIELGQGLSHDIVIHQTLPFLGTQAHPEASSYFCQHDIQNLTISEEKLTQDDGERLIRRFFEYFHII